MEDILLFTRFAAGEREAVEFVVREYSGGLLVFVYGILKDIHASEDIVEDAFAALIGGKAKFRGDSAFRTYLYRTARNMAYNYQRKHRRTVPLDTLEMTAESSSLEERYIRQERNAQLYRALDKLSRDYRTVLLLIYFEEMSYAQAASVMGKNVSQIKNLAHRGRLALREILVKEGFSYED